MTDHGEPYEGERRKGKQTARAKGGGLDPVGKEDSDIDNDGDVDIAVANGRHWSQFNQIFIMTVQGFLGVVN